MDIMVGSCEQTRADLSSHLEGELRGLRVRLHLRGCSACAAVARSLRKTIERLRQLDEHFAATPSPSLVPAVLERIRTLDRE